ncbi:hypothetical protein Lesp02_82040 [Lentzea sp. NBRC 105346]|uniref:hypothetical protein n=1 Tax=Lentzea sp. NBRC 105346 TaxID=3032205 RepID=UPI00249FCF1B|nr:hypothetical protein [Lentzea sp. NBRC 105346]GLZ36017.1 hypothetical protein Lesp02_82040 [Lentzea sp. NBRC 105346]
MTVLTVAARFNGPPTTGNGGYVAGLLAGFVDTKDAVSVRLRVPPPLETPLEVRVDGADAELRHGDVVVAAATPAELDIVLPDVPSVEQARAAAAAMPPRTRHPFPTCFGCGPDRPPGEAIHALLGPVDDTVWAGVWRPGPLLPHADGQVRPEVVWSALDCPSAQPIAPDGGPAHVLGTFTARLDHPVVLDADHVLLAWSLGREGRKAWSASAIVAPDGQVCGVAKAVWISIG